MSKREFSSIVFKLAGVCMLARLLGFLPMIFNAFCSGQHADPMQSLSWHLLTFAAPVLGLLIGIFMIAGSEWIAARLIRNDGEFTPGFNLSREEVLSIAFCCIGLITLVNALPKLFYSAVNFVQLSRISGCSLLQPQYGLESLVRTCGQYIIQALIGLALFLKPHRLEHFIRKRQNEDKTCQSQMPE